jgi:MraZ protein
MLIGQYELALGEKNRIALPKKLRSELGTDLILTRGYDGCALLLDKTLWQKLITDIGNASLFRLSARDTRRYLLGGAQECELDNQGRFVLPEYILQHSQVTKDVVLLGLGDWVELWSKEQWSAKSEFLAKNASDIAEKLISLNK